MYSKYNKNKTKIEWNFPYMTDHFIRRYLERISLESNHKKDNKAIYIDIRRDIEKRMTSKEQVAFRLFSRSSLSVIPFNKINKIVIKNNVLISVY